MSLHDNDRLEIASLVESYRLAWVNLDIEYLKSLWKEDEDGLVYIALEMAEPMHDPATIRKYLDRAKEECAPPQMSVDELSIKVIGDIATTCFLFRFEFNFVGKTEWIVADGRVTMVLRRTADGWKLIVYHEALRGHRETPA